MPGILSSLMQAKRESFFLFSGCGGGWIHLHIQRSFKKPPLSLPHCVVCGGLGEPSKGGANGFTAGILSSPLSTLGANALRIVCPESFFRGFLSCLTRLFKSERFHSLSISHVRTTRKKRKNVSWQMQFSCLRPFALFPPPHCPLLRFFVFRRKYIGRLLCPGNWFVAPVETVFSPHLRFVG